MASRPGREDKIWQGLPLLIPSPPGPVPLPVSPSSRNDPLHLCSTLPQFLHCSAFYLCCLALCWWPGIRIQLLQNGAGLTAGAVTCESSKGTFQCFYNSKHQCSGCRPATSIYRIVLLRVFFWCIVGKPDNC